MSLRILPDLVQGTTEWHDQRRGMVTASVVDRLLTTKTLKVADNQGSRDLTMLLTGERITGNTDPTWQSDDMMRGVYDEPIARHIYGEHYAQVTECGFMVREIDGFELGYSPDGLVGDDGLIEVKSRRQKNHLATVLDDAAPSENMAQLQCGLLVSGRSWIDYISYCSGMNMWSKRIYPDQKWFDAILAALKEFEKNSAEMADKYLKAVEGLPQTERYEQDMVI